jgi:enamine deaminase RidA (YjgF/YER057c/UK114 family)
VLSRFVNPDSLTRPVGFAHGVLVDDTRRLLFLGGQIGWDGEGKLEPDFVRQFARALSNVLEVVRAAGGGPEHIVQLRVYVTDREEYRAARREIGEIWQGLMGRHYPAMALLEVAGLLERGARVEIEGMAAL